MPLPKWVVQNPLKPPRGGCPEAPPPRHVGAATFPAAPKLGLATSPHQVGAAKPQWVLQLPPQVGALKPPPPGPKVGAATPPVGGLQNFSGCCNLP